MTRSVLSGLLIKIITILFIKIKSSLRKDYDMMWRLMVMCAIEGGLSQVIGNGQGKRIVQGQAKVREFYFESEKIDIFKETLY